jgi:cyanophycin synthetase
VAIAQAAAGRFDHYFCRRDDALRGREPDEVPRLIAAALRERGVPEAAISVIPDEQEAVDAALRMGQPGDLLLVFADALVRSWKQITKFRTSDGAGAPAEAVARGSGGMLEAHEPSRGASFVPPADAAAAFVATPVDAAGKLEPLNLEGLIRDERGVRLAPESDD